MTRRAIAVLTIGAGALVVVLGSLFPLYGVETTARPGVNGPIEEGVLRMVALTGWEYVREPMPPGIRAGDDFAFPAYGHGLVFAAVLAAIGALAQLRSPRVAAIGRFGVLTAFGIVVGTLWAAVETLGTLFGGGSPSTSATTTEEFVGTGTWLVGAAALALLVGAAVAHDWPAPVPRPAGVSVYQVDDDDTPPFGIAIPVTELEVPPAPVSPDGSMSPGGSVAPDRSAWPVAPPVAELPPVVELPGEPRSSVDDRRHPTGGNSSTVD